MVEETGKVIRLDGNMATVLVQRKSACEGCAGGEACTSTPEGMEIDALNIAHAKEGDMVEVLMAPQEYLKGSVMMYGVPLVLFIAGAIAGKNLGESYLTDMNSDLVAAITGFLFLVLSILGVKVWSTRHESSPESRPVIEKIIEST